MKRTWMILGATSIIAEQFAHISAQKGHALRLVGRNASQLDLIAKDIKLRYRVLCETLVLDAAHTTSQLKNVFAAQHTECDLFIAHSECTENADLSPESITSMVDTNILSPFLLIQAYWALPQKEHHLIYLSSVAGVRGRAKNSLYGASKAAVEIYLEGLQQAATPQQHITIARLGFIDTRQTYGVPGVFYAAPPKACARAIWNASRNKKRLIYYPFFWRVIMGVIGALPFGFYKRIKKR